MRCVCGLKLTHDLKKWNTYCFSLITILQYVEHCLKKKKFFDYNITVCKILLKIKKNK